VTLLSVTVSINFLYDSLYICATFQVFSVEVDALFGCYVDSFKLGVPNMRRLQDKYDSTCIAYWYCIL